MRKSILACTVSLLMSPVATWALGIGDVQVNSSLNQPLHAEIGVHSATKKDIESLRINIASKEAFNKAGLVRSHYLTKLKFNVIQKNGQSVVVITTGKSFKEPYIEFLIEASWGSGRLIREYTILVDPPDFLTNQSVPVKIAEVNSTSEVRRDITSLMEGLSYGPTKYNDTLWTIAKNLSPDDVTINQMMLALLRENPKAFINNNINNLKAGYVLRINDQKTLYKLDKRTAQREVNQQYQAWKELRSQQTANTNLVDRSERNDAVKNEGELKLVASGKSDDTDKINKDSNVDEQAKEIREKLALSIEAIDSATSENLELRERVKELEAILETKSSLMDLKDASLAALQKQIEVKNLEVPEDLKTEENIETPAQSEVIDETIGIGEIINPEFADHIDASVELVKDEQLVLDMAAKKETDANIEMAAEVAVKEQLIESEKQESIILPFKDKIVETDKKAQEKPKTPVKKSVVSKPDEKPLTPLYEEIAALLVVEYLPFIAGGLGLLVILLIVLKSRGGKKDQDFEESIIDKHTLKVDSEYFQEQNKSAQIDDNETSFISDFSAENTESLMPDDTEDDPLSEADVFMVYGRYLQAEEFLNEVIEKEPQRIDFKMKLLEVYLGDNQKDAFVAQAELIKGLIIDEDENVEVSSDWATIVAWAKKLDINLSPEDSIEDSASVDEADTENDNFDGVVDDGEASLDEIVDTIEEDSETSSESSLDDNLDVFEQLEESNEEPIDESGEEFEIPADASTDLEFDTIENSEQKSNLLIDLEETSVVEQNNSNNLEPEEGLSLDIEESESELTEIDLDDSLELDDFELEEVVESNSDETIEEISDDLSNVDLEDDLSLDSFDLDMSDLDIDGDMEEANAVDTKLDLARAYIDMEDLDSASSILTEVLNDGDEEQKSQAKALQEQANSQ